MTPCTCDKWKENAPLDDQSAKDGGIFWLLNSFEFCPWCGKSLSGSEKPREEPKTITERESAAESAFRRDIDKQRDEFDILMIERRLIPKGAKLVECYETEKNFVVIGIPDSNDETHNCDFMGCSTLSHVIARFPKRPLPTQPEE